MFEKIDDAAEVHRLTGTAPAVALHFPWDAVDDLGDAVEPACAPAACASARSTPTSSRTPTTAWARSPTPTRRIRRKAVEHLLECVRDRPALGSTAQSLWLADGTNYAGPGRPARRAARRLLDGLGELYAALPAEQELLVEYKLFEPAFYATDIADWGSALLLCQALGERARVLVDLGHHAQGVNVEQIVAILAGEGRLGGLPLQQPQVRRRRPDRRLGQSVRAVPHLRRAGGSGDGPLPRLTIDQSHNVEAKVEAMVLSVVNLQEAYAKALLVDRARAAPGPGRGRRARAATSCCSTPTTPTCARCARRCAGSWVPPRIRSRSCAPRAMRPRMAGAATRRPRAVEAGR